MTIDKGIAERLKRIHSLIEEATTDATKQKILTCLGSIIYTLTGERPEPVKYTFTATVLEDKRECIPCKQLMIEAMKREEQ